MRDHVRAFTFYKYLITYPNIKYVQKIIITYSFHVRANIELQTFNE